MAPLLMMVCLVGWLLKKLVQGCETTLVHCLALQFVLSAGLLHSVRLACVGLLQGFVAWWPWALCFDLGMVEVTSFFSLCAWQQNLLGCSGQFGSSDPRQGLSAHPQIDSMA